MPYYGLDQPLWKQYLGYLGNFVRFDLGPSYTYQSESVNEVITRLFSDLVADRNLLEDR